MRLLKVAPDGLVGHHPAKLDIRSRTGCSVVAVERDERALLEFDEQFRFAEGDAVYVCGSTAATRRFRKTFQEG